MKQLFISKDIEIIAESYKIEFLNSFKVEIETKLNDIINHLDLADTEYVIKKEYIENILNNLEDIILLKPSQMKAKFSLYLLPTNDKTFYIKIVAALHYNKVREKYFIKTIKQLQINCCAYCHTQTTHIVNEYYVRNYKPHKKGDIKSQKAFFELDHYFPKSKYPFLCVSFYNLIPICSSCNKAKKDQFIDFDFYVESETLFQDFKFILSKGNVADYITSQDSNKLVIDIDHPNKKILKSFTERFSLNLRYNEYKDIVEEIIYKEMKFNKIYLDSVSNILNNHPTDKKYLIKNIILGNYSDKKDILKRPLAKFYQDISEHIKSFNITNT